MRFFSFRVLSVLMALPRVVAPQPLIVAHVAEVEAQQGAPGAQQLVAQHHRQRSPVELVAAGLDGVGGQRRPVARRGGLRLRAGYLHVRRLLGQHRERTLVVAVLLEAREVRKARAAVGHKFLAPFVDGHPSRYQFHALSRLLDDEAAAPKLQRVRYAGIAVGTEGIEQVALRPFFFHVRLLEGEDARTPPLTC